MSSTRRSASAPTVPVLRRGGGGAHGVLLAWVQVNVFAVVCRACRRKQAVGHAYCLSLNQAWAIRSINLKVPVAMPNARRCGFRRARTKCFATALAAWHVGEPGGHEVDDGDHAEFAGVRGRRPTRLRRTVAILPPCMSPHCCGACARGLRCANGFAVQRCAPSPWAGRNSFSAVSLNRGRSRSTTDMGNVQTKAALDAQGREREAASVARRVALSRFPQSRRVVRTEARLASSTASAGCRRSTATTGLHLAGSSGRPMPW